MLTRLRGHKEPDLPADIATRLTAVTGPISVPSPAPPPLPQPIEGRLVHSDGALAAVLGCDNDNEVLIGRARNCAVRLLELSVSRNHAAIRWDPERGAHTLFDCGSANGTFVDGARIASESPINDGALVRFGGLELRYLLIRELP